MKTKTQPFTEAEVVNHINSESSSDYDHKAELLVFYYGDTNDPRILTAEVMMTRFGPGVHLKESFPQLTRGTISNEKYSDGKYWNDQLDDNYKVYLERHGMRVVCPLN